jgi:gas vesicle protein
MLRIATVAAVAALIAAPASAESIRISTSGKSVEQMREEIRKAAEVVCRREFSTTLDLTGSRAACVNGSARDAMAQLGIAAPVTVATR